MDKCVSTSPSSTVADVMPHADRLVSLAAGTMLDVGPADAVTVAHDAGWPAVGIWFDPATWTAATTAAVRSRLDDTGTIALDIEPIIFGPDGDPGDALVDTAIAIGARYVLVTSRVPVEPRIVDRFGQLCDRAAAGGVTLALEFLPIFPLSTLAAAIDVVHASGRPNSGVLVDTLHLSRSGGSVAELAAVDAALLPYLQLADAPAAPPDSSIATLVDEALHGRLLLGDGALPISDVLDTVADVPVSFELRSRTLMAAHPDPTARARAVLDNWRAFSR